MPTKEVRTRCAQIWIDTKLGALRAFATGASADQLVPKAKLAMTRRRPYARCRSSFCTTGFDFTSNEVFAWASAHRVCQHIIARAKSMQNRACQSLQGRLRSCTLERAFVVHSQSRSGGPVRWVANHNNIHQHFALGYQPSGLCGADHRIAWSAEQPRPTLLITRCSSGEATPSSLDTWLHLGLGCCEPSLV
ncbi:hypothetical protein ACVWW1_008531 [Bradyrhizobium sp. JR3.5]